MEVSSVDAGRRVTVAMGLVLVVVGGLALAGEALDIDLLGLGWPLFVLIPGVLMFVAALAVGGRAGVGLAIPGGVVTMTGLVLAFQNTTGLWATWAYAWALVAPGGVGLALVAYGLATAQPDLGRAGLPVLATGLALFLGFGLFFEGVLGLNGRAFVGLESALAVGLVVLGGVIVLSGLRRDRR